MLAGVVFHAAMGFAEVPGFDIWPVRDPAANKDWLAFVAVLHVFRMPLFFCVAGFLLATVLARKPAGEVLRSRLLRVGVPFTLGMIFLTPLVGLTAMWASRSTGRAPADASLFELYRAFLAKKSWLEQATPMHLWFLEFLLIYSAVAIGLFVLWRRSCPTTETTPRRGWTYINYLAVVFALCAAASVAALPMDMRFIETPRTLLPPRGVLVFYGLFFAIGFAMARAVGDRTPAWLKVPRWRLLTSGVACAFLAIIGPLLPGEPGDPPFGRVFLYVLGVAGAVQALTMWGAVTTWKQGRAFRYLSDASYWTYLVHLPFVWVAHAAVFNAPWPAVLKLTFICLAATLACLATYQLFVRHTPIGRALNGPARRA